MAEEADNNEILDNPPVLGFEFPEEGAEDDNF